MILDSYDIIAIEANISIAEYAMESAQYEINNGNDEFIPVYEVAENSANKESDLWISKIINKVKVFVKSVISKIKMILNQFTLTSKRKNIDKMQKKLEKNRHNRSDVFVKINKEIASNLNTMVKYNLIKADEYGTVQHTLAYEVNALPAYIMRCVRENEVPKSFNEFYKNYVDVLPKPEYANKAYFKDDSELSEYNTISFLYDAETALKNLYLSTSKIYNYNKRLKNEGFKTSEIQYATSTIYNYMTILVTTFYKCAINVAKFFLKESKNNISSEIKYGDEDIDEGDS